MTTNRKRSLFTIDVTDDQLNSSVDQEPVSAPRRTPMAMAVKENFAALGDRQQTDVRIRQENDQLALEFVRLRRLGLITEPLRIDAIDSHELVRDRLNSSDPELEELKRSIADIGLSNPIRVRRSGEGRFELVQGSRRLAAYKTLYDESATDEERERWSVIPAAYFSNDDDLATSYRKMVDENLVRKDISFGEMALLAMRYAQDPRLPDSDVDAAVAHLFKAAAYSKRSNIRAFVQLLMMLGESVSNLSAIPRNLGLDVRRRLEKRPVELQTLRAALAAVNDADAEIEVLRRFVKGQLAPARTEKKKSIPSSELSLLAGESALRCRWRNNRLLIQGKVLGELDRDQLNQALQAFASCLEQAVDAK